MSKSTKILRKQRRAQHRVARDMNIKCSDNPTQYLMICNAGLVTGLQRETVHDTVKNFVPNYDLIMPTGKSYCFLKFTTPDDARIVYDAVHGQSIFQDDTPVYLTFTETIPSEEENSWNGSLPPGLTLIEDFLTLDEEKSILQFLDWSEVSDGTNPSELKHRQVKHFGYEFRYDTNRVDPENPIAPIPPSYKFLLDRLKKVDCKNFDYDQLTINRYVPGQGIPPHIDTHSPFEDTILSVSLGSACVMEFKRNDEKSLVLLPSRSLLIMSGESRYAWAHGITPRHSDVVKTSNGTTVLQRSTRTSFTFRKVRRDDCRCAWPEYCDSQRNYSPVMNNKVAFDIEQAYVHTVYEQISDHFSETRHKQWPNVTKFIDSLKMGAFMLDVGCGNGKYLHGRSDIVKVGCDRSSGLAGVCHDRGFSVLLADCLQIPFKDRSLDAVISIAVIHHLSTSERRMKAISEMIRVLKPGGKCLIYVWAKEQKKDAIKSTYLRCGTKKNTKHQNTPSPTMTTIGNTILPVHENRTEFTHSDMLVPWKRKGGGDFLRYYHVFEEGELQDLCSKVSNVITKEIYYDQGNWCAVLEKVVN